jgi:hypothetical protein
VWRGGRRGEIQLRRRRKKKKKEEESQARRKEKRLEEGSLDHDAGDLIRVDVRGRSSVLKVASALLGDVTGDSNGAASVGDAPGELANVSGLVLARQSLVVVLSVDGDVLDCWERKRRQRIQV